ncbi:FtsK/SpoIIIE domain-containing protein [Schlesneria sp. T3-172]|uniref:FtsK/SpoIIIE domain-containing protein n=1 Tax=Schlesneria sphaerica TaxID=3373610 RepID=UPI0037C6BF7A
MKSVLSPSAERSLLGPITLSDQLSLENERQLLKNLLERVSHRLACEQEIEARHADEAQSEQEQYQNVLQLLTETYENEQTEREQSFRSHLATLHQRCDADASKIQSDYSSRLTRAEDRLASETELAEKERDEAVWLVSSLLDEDSDGSPLVRLKQTERELTATGNELTAGLKGLDDGHDRVVRFLQRCRIWNDPGEVTPTLPLSSVEVMKSACLAEVAAAEPLQQRILARLLPRLFAGPFPLLLFLLIAGTLFGLLYGVVDPSLVTLKLKATDRDWMWICAGVASATGLVLIMFLHLYASRRTYPDYEQLVQHRANAHYAYSVWDKDGRSELNTLSAQCADLNDQRAKRRESAISAADNKLTTRITQLQREYMEAVDQANATFPVLLRQVEEYRQKETEAAQRSYRLDMDALRFRRESDFRQLQTEFDSRVAEGRNRYQQAWLQLIHTWKTDLAKLGQQSSGLLTKADSLCPSWESLASREVPPPESSPAVLSLGRIEVDLDMIDGGVSTDPRLSIDQPRFDLPLLLPLQERPSLVLKGAGSGRDAAVSVLQSTVLRFLTSLPPGKVRLTILDPVGLGANFAAFMHLADYDELLVSSRIWSEPAHIEKKLGELTEHMETVLQTYLRNEFPTIDDYNQFAGEVAEPYRLLVIANFPANFTDVALRRLVSIAEGGRRCGVFILMSVDQSQELPRSFSLANLEKSATVLQWKGDGFRLTDSDLAAWPLALELPPPSEVFGQIVRSAGELARDVRRVEVPFSRVAPQDSELWKGDSRKGIDVPIGRAGATKLQYLRLGKGTSQHVLIAGKTGSGKSTLLHALITNLSLYYSPAEVEFYLIDFKKGVEFKVYAEEQLPSARVIAIESDREFGVSVLQRLDALLRDRGERFRAARAQDIAAFRDARPDVVMPRTLLLIDEFQEFFIEDDALSQQASLLLDRLIRQGRAFGVHVLLGSQTLAGAYSLARSTLGQVAVRIALQCSETDAHLILSEENTAARLLTRPGEAIYNDANGLVEGNHPFQVVWLDEDERGQRLKWIREAANMPNEASGRDPHDTTSGISPLVFEGNVPADIKSNRRLTRLLAKSRLVSPALGAERQQIPEPWTCWIGDSVAMSGPIELRFGLREGANILIVGRDDTMALGVMAASALALCAQAAGHGLHTHTVHLLDGSLPNNASVQTWQQLVSLWNRPSSRDSAAKRENIPEHASLMRIASPRDTATVMIDILAELRRRADEPGPPIFLFVYDLARFRDLRKSEDDFGFGASSDKPTNSAQVFGEILRDGPSVGIFTLAWVDSYATAQRWLARDQMNRFEHRILFSMNANDSASLVDSPLAGRLGENRALLYRGDLGTLEKLRPYSPPAAEWLESYVDRESRESSPGLELEDTGADPVGHSAPEGHS